MGCRTVSAGEVKTSNKTPLTLRSCDSSSPNLRLATYSEEKGEKAVRPALSQLKSAE